MGMIWDSYLSLDFISFSLPVVPHKTVEEVSEIGNL
jgi:hypothetical protein